ncbi:MAG: polysaccharide biosynthesis/export family protein [Acidobacteriota bacterium]
MNAPRHCFRSAPLLLALLILSLPALGQAQEKRPDQATPPNAEQQPFTAPSPSQSAPSSGAAADALDYRIGPGDVLAIRFWRDNDLSAEVVVRPDGLITLPVLNEVEAVGLTTEELRERVAEKALKFVTQPPVVSVFVRQIRSRSVYITGRVVRPGTYSLNGPLTVVQLIALAGGLGEYAKSKEIVILRAEGDKQVSFRFNYKDVVNLRALTQNIALRPGDTVIVP